MLPEAKELYETNLSKKPITKLILSIGALLSVAQPTIGQEQAIIESTYPEVINSKTFSKKFNPGKYYLVKVNNEIYYAYELHNKTPEIPDRAMPWDFSVTNPWLVTTGSGKIVTGEKSTQASLAASYVKKMNTTLVNELYNESGLLNKIVSQSKTPEALLGVTKPAIGALSKTLITAGIGLPVTMNSAMLEIAKQEAIAFAKSFVSKDFKQSMYLTIENSSKELAMIAEHIQKNPGVRRDYKFVKEISQKIVEAKTQSRSALIALQDYYGSDQSKAVWNFFTEQVVEGVVGFDFIKNTSLEKYFWDVAVSRKMFEGVYGMKSIEKGQDLVHDYIKEFSINHAENQFKDSLSGIGFEPLFQLYNSIKSRALKGSIQDKIDYMVFANDTFSSILPTDIQSKDHKKAIKTINKLKKLKPKEFVIEYDKIIKKSLVDGDNVYFAAAANLLLPYVQAYTQSPEPQYSRPRLIISPLDHLRTGFNSQALHDIYTSSIQRAEEYINLVEKERPGSTKNRRKELYQLKTYHSVFHGGTLSSSQKSSLRFMLEQNIKRFSN